jgi:hypothetical protein
MPNVTLQLIYLFHFGAQKITNLSQSAYGSEDRRTVRAQEVRDAIQRLQWAMEGAKTMTA